MRTWSGNEAIGEVKSASHGPWLRQSFWLSSARLDSSFNQKFGKRFAVPVYGFGWGVNRRESEESSRRDALLWQAYLLLDQDSPNYGHFGSDKSRFGYSLTDRNLSPQAGFSQSLYEILGPWLVEKIVNAPDPKLKLHRVRITDSLTNILFSSRENHLVTYWAQIPAGHSTSPSDVVIVTLESRFGGIHLASGAGATFRCARRMALRRLFLNKRKFERMIEGSEQILDQMADQRLFLLGISSEQKEKLTRRLTEASEKTFQPISASWFPQLKIFGEIHGPWSSEFRLCRVLAEDLSPLDEGPFERIVG